MAKRAGLRSRIEKLEEQRRSNGRLVPRFIYSLCPQENAGEITGFMAGNVAFVRLDTETVEQCCERALAATDALSLIATYALQERETAVLTTPASLAALDTPSGPEIESGDGFALAGIGRTATPEELWEMGALRGPP